MFHTQSYAKADLEVMPGEVHVAKALDMKTSNGQTEGMIRQGAIIDKSDKVCASSTLQYLIA